MKIMADEVLLQLLQMEIVGAVHRDSYNSEKFDNTACKNDEQICKVESIGFRVGQAVIERITIDSSRIKGELDTIKFICQDLWKIVFKKQIDNLKTNHQGLYVLQDKMCQFLLNISNGKQYMECAVKYLAFPCGLIGGALSHMGINSIVTANVNIMPVCEFHIKIQQ